MKSFDPFEVGIIALVFGLGCYFAGFTVGSIRLRREAISEGHAHYVLTNDTSSVAVFQWKAMKP